MEKTPNKIEIELEFTGRKVKERPF